MNASSSAILRQQNYLAPILALAKKYHLPLVDSLSAQEFVLYFSENRLYLHWWQGDENPRATKSNSKQTDLKPKKFTINYLEPAFFNRLKQASRHSELVARACHIKNQKNLKLIDMTCGLGFDAMILTKTGFQVLAIERQPALAALLEQAFKEINLPISLIFSESGSYLKNLAEADYPDVIYFDPIFPQKFKRARSQKYLHLLQHLCIEDDDETALFKLALKKARQRLVVKRPIQAPFILAQQPNFSLAGR